MKSSNARIWQRTGSDTGMPSVGQSSMGTRPETPPRGRSTPEHAGTPSVSSPRVLFASGQPRASVEAPADEEFEKFEANPHLRSELEPLATSTTSPPTPQVGRPTPSASSPWGMEVRTGGPDIVDKIAAAPRKGPSPTFVTSKAKMQVAVTKISVGAEIRNQGKLRKKRRNRHLVRGL